MGSRKTVRKFSMLVKKLCHRLRILISGNIEIGESDPNQSLLLIGDDLLMEILSRIPTTVVAIRCKLVCKSWCALISSPYFISRFKQQHIEHGSRYPKPSSGMLANHVHKFRMLNPEFNFRGFNLNYLPGKIDVVASCNDLILCRASCNYYLCNPFTTQWIALPPLHPGRVRRTGLVCVPYNGGDGFRYRIVLFYMEYDQFMYGMDVRSWSRYRVDMYCSETGEWIPCDDLDEEHYWCESNTAAYNGKLYWANRDGSYLVSYDPFDMTQTSRRLIHGADRDSLCHSRRCLVEECEGVLRVMRLELMFKGISLWELREEEVIFKDHIVFNVRKSHFRLKLRRHCWFSSKE